VPLVVSAPEQSERIETDAGSVADFSGGAVPEVPDIPNDLIDRNLSSGASTDIAIPFDAASVEEALGLVLLDEEPGPPDTEHVAIRSALAAGRLGLAYHGPAPRR
jgi:hypothetical protein